MSEPTNTPPEPLKNVEAGDQNQAIGRSAGGLSTKIHAACDGLGNPLKFILTSGQTSDYVEALNLISDRKYKALLADRGYDADYIIDEARAVGEEAVIPPKSNRSLKREFDKDLYKERNLIEKLFNKLKNFRRIATRYDKLSITFLSFIHVAAIYLWLK